MAATLPDIRGQLECLEALHNVKGVLNLGDYEIDFALEQAI